MRPFKNKLAGHLGHDADDPSAGDSAFYEWIAGPAERPTDLELFLWLLDELKTETEPARIRTLLAQWHKTCEPDEFLLRLTVLSKLLPADHPFHAVKTEFSP